MNIIGKGSGISKAELREQKMKDMLKGVVKAKPLATPTETKKVKPVRVRNAPVYPYDLTIYTTKGTLRKNPSPLDRSFKSETHVKIKETGELVTRKEWDSREAKRIYQLRIDLMKCVRCGRPRGRTEFITCEYCCTPKKAL